MHRNSTCMVVCAVLSPLGCTCCLLICAVGLHLFCFFFVAVGLHLFGFFVLCRRWAAPVLFFCRRWAAPVAGLFAPLGCTCLVFFFRRWAAPFGVFRSLSRWAAPALPLKSRWDTRLPCMQVIWNWKFPKFNSIQKFPKHLNPTKTFYKSPQKIHNTIKIQKSKSKNSNHAKSKIQFFLL